MGRGQKRYLRGMGLAAKIFFFGMLSAFTLLAIFAAIGGWWIHAFASILLGVAFLASAPFVLGRGWRASQPEPTRRPVVRRRR
jgi:hypothetical protein